jgi:hypothetical protein
VAAEKKKGRGRRPPRKPAAAEPESAQVALALQGKADPRVIREVVRARMASNDFALAHELVDSLVTMAQTAEKDSDRLRAIEKLFQYHEPPPAQEKPKAGETHAPESVRKSVVVHATMEDLAKMDPDSPVFGVLRKQIVLEAKTVPAKEP